MWKGTGCFECSMPLIWEPVSFNVFKAINHLRINNVWIGRGYSFGETFFYYHSVGIINKDFENILISLFKMKNRELLEASIYCLNPKRYCLVFRWCNDGCNFFIMTDRGAQLNLCAKRFTVIRINIPLTWQLPNMISVIIPELGLHLRIGTLGQGVIMARNINPWTVV